MTTELGATMIEAVVPFSTRAAVDPSPYELSLFGRAGERTSALVRLDYAPASATDVVEGTAEVVTRAGLLFSRWELRERGDSSLIAHADTEQTFIGPFEPFPCRVRLFGNGAS